MNSSVSYYNDNADSFFQETLNVDMSSLYGAFLSQVPSGGHILDAGCGSGRDASAFQELHYRVSAFDASPELVARINDHFKHLHAEVRTFDQVTEKAVYDGIWACASLLHVPVDRLPDCFQRLWAALKPGGVLYVSFKLGQGEREHHGRWFTDANEADLKQWISALPSLGETTFWCTEDKRPDRTENWLNGLIHKKGEQPKQLITGGAEQHFLPHLCQAINEATEVDMAVAFIRNTGLKLLMPDLKAALKPGPEKSRIRILTSDYLDVTDPESLRNLMLLQEMGAQIRVYESAGSSFHIKAYLFAGNGADGKHWGKAFIGSSNISQQALQSGLEWNYRVDYPADAGYLEAISRFEELFSHPRSVALSDPWIEAYEQRRQPPPLSVSPGSQETDPPPVPNSVQSSALRALEQSRDHGYRRGLVVLATGLGKTWLAAFDAAQTGSRRVLFVAHREEILSQAAETFIRIRPGIRVGYYMGQRRDQDVDVLCASVQTLGRERHLERFSPSHFDYIVVDEFHHAAAPTYHRLLNHFAPSFLLGLTATPDRTDCSDILSLCDDNLVYEHNLFEGIRARLLAPFHYYGIYDESVDYQEIPWRNGRFDPNQLANKLATLHRARHAQKVWKQYAQKRTLAFCVSRLHADFMAEQFQKQGISAAAVHGKSGLSRGEALEQLNSGELKVIFSVDLFNEGVDLPTIDTVMLLRPTESKILFLQQLGRGLRLAEGKERLMVLDFVGNHQSFLHKPQALMGQTMNQRQLADYARDIENRRLDLPDGCFINYDLQLIDFLKSLSGEGAIKDYEALRDSMNRRPTLSEFYRSGASIPQMRKNHTSWYRFVVEMGDLLPAEQSLAKSQHDFLSELEVTKMTRCYKMILLEAFQELNGWHQAPAISRLADKSLQVLQRRPHLLTELPEELRNLKEGMNSKWLHYWRKNPINAWTGGNQSNSPLFFAENEGYFSHRLNLNSEQADTFMEMVQEIIDYRLAAYSARKTEVDPETLTNPDSLGGTKGTELAYFPSLKIACGHFKASSVEAEECRRLPSRYGKLDSARHFIARASGNSMNGGKSPIEDGDYLLLEQITPDKAGSITGQTLAIERQNEAGDNEYLLRVVRKNSEGQYLLHANNPEYEDILVTEEMSDQFRTFARLKGIVDPMELAIGQSFMREEIPPLFGAEFNPGNWNSGHVVLNDQKEHILLVTLNKQGRLEEHRYLDRWIDDQHFQWESQNATAPSSKKGKEIIEHQERGIRLHLFVRENRIVGGKGASFTYYGPVSYERHEGSKPMRVVFRVDSST